MLDRGAIDAETIEPGQARIVSERFEVEFVDAALTVTPTSVRVHRGTVRVVDHGRTVLAQLEPGGTWQPAEAAAAGRTPARRPQLARTASELLAQAHAEFSAKDYAAAERSAQAAIASKPSKLEEAEARMMLADAAQASGNLDIAVERYDLVTTRFATLPAAETALYAAARIELRRSRRDAARALLDRYLATYPAGRYADDVRKQLASLP